MTGDCHVRFCERLRGETPLCLLGERKKKETRGSIKYKVLSTKYNVPSTFKIMIAVDRQRAVRFLCVLAPLLVP